MSSHNPAPIRFEKETVIARFVDPEGVRAEKSVEIRTNPVTGRTCRITFARQGEKEAGAASLPGRPPDADRRDACPFCRPQAAERTPRMISEISPSARLTHGDSTLFPNLFPYGGFSAVSLFDDRHFVEIGTADLQSYTDSFINSRNYLKKVTAYDPEAVFMAVTQNHLPSAGGSLVHPHLQVHAERIGSNHHRFLGEKAEMYHRQGGRFLFSDYLEREKENKVRYIGRTGPWEWLAAYAPEGFFEIWGVLPDRFSLIELTDAELESLSAGVLNAQKFFRSLNRNGYNLGVLSIERADSRLELRASLMVRSNYAPWVRNDHTGYEVMLGDMATFTAPEETAEMARPFWSS